MHQWQAHLFALQVLQGLAKIKAIAALAQLLDEQLLPLNLRHICTRASPIVLGVRIDMH